MSDVHVSHPTPSQLIAFGLNRLSAAEAAAVQGHLDRCPNCRRLIESSEPETMAPVSDATSGTKPAAEGKTPRPTPAQEAATLAAPGAELSPPGYSSIPPALRDHPKYRVLELLGIGGMGSVYKAEHKVMERLVALKVINPALLLSPGAVERFHLEVRAAAKLSHPNIVTAFDAETAGDLHFLVMEYVEGTSLAHVLEKMGKLPVAHACEYIRQAALGMQHAHEKGMIHRDIKPHNLMVTRKNWVKILDFGLARLIGERKEGKGLTDAGVVMGTPDYMAPEQATEARQCDIRADIYSLGCTLYHLLTGQPPFPDGNSVMKILGHLEHQPAPMTQFRHDLPVDLIEIVHKMMAKKPEHRFQTPAEVSRALAPLVKTGVATQSGSHPSLTPPAKKLDPSGPQRARPAAPPTPPPAAVEVPEAIPLAPAKKPARATETRTEKTPLSKKKPKKRAHQEKRDFWSENGLAVGIGGGVLVVLVLVTLFFVFLRPGGGGTAEVSVSTGGLPYHVVITHDGKPMATVEADQVLTLQTGEYDVALEGAPPNLVTVTPNHLIVKKGERQSVVVAKLPDEVRQLTDQGMGPVARVALSPNGRWAAACTGDRFVRVFDLNGESGLRISGANGAIRCVAFSPDNLVVATGGEDESLRLWRLDTRQDAGVASHDRPITAVVFSADGSRIATGDDQGWVRVWSSNSFVQPLYELKVHSYQVRDLAFSPDHQKLLSGSWDKSVRMWDLRTQKERPLAHTPTRINQVELSADGRIALAVGEDKIIRWWDAEQGAELGTLGDERSGFTAVAFFPDGQRLAAGGDAGVTVWNLPAHREVSRFTGHVGPINSVAVSGDSRFILSGGDDRTIRLWRVR